MRLVNEIKITQKERFLYKESICLINERFRDRVFCRTFVNVYYCIYIITSLQLNDLYISYRQ